MMDQTRIWTRAPWVSSQVLSGLWHWYLSRSSLPVTSYFGYPKRDIKYDWANWSQLFRVLKAKLIAICRRRVSKKLGIGYYVGFFFFKTVETLSQKHVPVTLCRNLLLYIQTVIMTINLKLLLFFVKSLTLISHKDLFCWQSSKYK